MVLADVVANCDIRFPLAGRRDPSLLMRGLLMSCRSLLSMVNGGSLVQKKLNHGCVVFRLPLSTVMDA